MSHPARTLWKPHVKMADANEGSGNKRDSGVGAAEADEIGPVDATTIADAVLRAVEGKMAASQGSLSSEISAQIAHGMQEVLTKVMSHQAQGPAGVQGAAGDAAKMLSSLAEIETKRIERSLTLTGVGVEQAPTSKLFSKVGKRASKDALRWSDYVWDQMFDEEFMQQLFPNGLTPDSHRPSQVAKTDSNGKVTAPKTVAKQPWLREGIRRASSAVVGSFVIPGLLVQGKNAPAPLTVSTGQSGRVEEYYDLPATKGSPQVGEISSLTETASAMGVSQRDVQFGKYSSVYKWVLEHILQAENLNRVLTNELAKHIRVYMDKDEVEKAIDILGNMDEVMQQTKLSVGAELRIAVGLGKRSHDRTYPDVNPHQLTDPSETHTKRAKTALAASTQAQHGSFSTRTGPGAPGPDKAVSEHQKRTSTGYTPRGGNGDHASVSTAGSGKKD